MTSTRSLHLQWSTPWATPPPSSCSTLILKSSTISYGATCVFPEGDAPSSMILPFNIACLPWLAPSTTPASNAFYSPATACPPSWSAVATQTSSLEQGIEGETALSCCPDGFEDGGGAVCKPASTGTFAVVECGEADAEENESRTYDGARWPSSATVSVSALQLRFRAADLLGSASSTGTTTESGEPAATSETIGEGGGDGGLSTGAKAAIGTVVPLFVLMLVLAVFLLWRRRKNRHAVARNDKAFAGTKAHLDSKNDIIETKPGVSQHPDTLETPEWNTELDAAEAERQGDPAPSAHAAQASASELGGLGRRLRKPVPAVEVEGSPVTAEMDVSRYMAYQPSRERVHES